MHGNLDQKKNLDALHHPQFRPVLQGLRQMGGCDLFLPGQIRNRARQLEHPVIGPRRKLHLVHGGAHQGVAGLIELAEFAHFGRAHIGVAGQIAFAESLPLQSHGRLPPAPAPFAEGSPRRSSLSFS